MKAFITEHPAAFLLSMAFGVTAVAGAGALALAAGAPLVPTLAVELGLYALIALAAAIFVPSSGGTAVSLALATGLPFLGFFGWIQTKAGPTTAATLVLVGIAGILAAVLAPRLRHHPATPFAPHEPQLG